MKHFRACKNVKGLFPTPIYRHVPAMSKFSENIRKIHSTSSIPDTDWHRHIESADFGKGFMLKIIDDHCPRIYIYDPVFPNSCRSIFCMYPLFFPDSGVYSKKKSDIIRSSLSFTNLAKKMHPVRLYFAIPVCL